MQRLQNVLANCLARTIWLRSHLNKVPNTTCRCEGRTEAETGDKITAALKCQLRLSYNEI
jgi:hypothetical protein